MTYDRVMNTNISVFPSKSLCVKFPPIPFPHKNEAQLILAGLQFKDTAPKYLEFVQLNQLMLGIQTIWK